MTRHLTSYTIQSIKARPKRHRTGGYFYVLPSQWKGKDALIINEETKERVLRPILTNRAFTYCRGVAEWADLDILIQVHDWNKQES